MNKGDSTSWPKKCVLTTAEECDSYGSDAKEEEIGGNQNLLPPTIYHSSMGSNLIKKV